MHKDLYARFGKRILDVVIAVCPASVVLAPVLLLLLLASAVAYRAWPLFNHERVGMNGEVFRVTKVRTLPPTTHPYDDKYAIRSASVPSIMQAVRRAHLDELPQLVHVLSGRMSLVGPRPEMPGLHQQMSADLAQRRTSVRPGLTGLWQVSVHCGMLITERPEYDCLYVDHANARLDLWILGATIRKIFFGRIFHLHEVPTWVLVGAPVSIVAREPVPRPLVTSVD